MVSHEALKVPIYLQENVFGGSFFSVKLSCWFRVYSYNFIKYELHHRDFPVWLVQDSSFKKFRIIFSPISLTYVF